MATAPIEQLTVCVIIPMYNAEATIALALQSLAIQTRMPDHVIVVDDGSSDRGARIVQSLELPFRLTFLQQENQGPSVARNTAIQVSGEHLLAFLDADDYWLPDKLEKQMALFSELTAQGRNVGLVDCFEMKFYDNGCQVLVDRIKHGRHFDDFVFRNIINGTSSVLALRSAIISAQGFDPRIRHAEDRWLWTQLAESHEIHTVPQVLSHRRIGTGNITENPESYYEYKVRFVDIYLAKYSHVLSRQQKIDFILSNHSEFLLAFSKKRSYRKVIEIFEHMLAHSWQALVFSKGKPAMRYLNARLNLLLRP